MPKSARCIVSWSQERKSYVWQDSEGESSLTEDTEGWREWLRDHHAFAFRSRHGSGNSLNLLKERRSRGGEGYWYAYQRRAGRMVKRYAGRSEQLSLTRLEEIASQMRDDQVISPARPADLSRQAQQPETLQAAIALPPEQTTHFEQLLMSKLQLPRLHRSLLRRERLMALMDTSLEHKLTVIAGPAGYGKTTLVVQWSAERCARADAPRIASVRLDEGDNDPFRFWHYVIAAYQQCSSGIGREALELLRAYRLLPFKPLEMMLTSLLNDLSKLEGPTVLILDDFHVIRSPQVIEALTFFLDHLPASCHLILLIRGDLPFSSARWRGRSELLEIYPSVLAFSVEETAAFFAQKLSFPLPPALLRLICERMAGWPTGLRLLARDLQASNSAQEIESLLATFTGSHWSVQDYFLNEVLSQLPEEQRTFLLQTSILPRFNAKLCDAITERTDSAAQLVSLHGGDLFLIPLDSTGEWARYQSLFAEALQQEAGKRLGTEQLHLLAHRASVWYEEHDHLVEAIETALRAEAFSRAAWLIERFSTFIQRGRVSTIPELYTLNGWLQQLPREELERSPDLCVQYAMTLLFLQVEGLPASGGREPIYALLQRAEQSWRDGNNIEKLAEIFAFRGLLARQDGHLLQAITWARQSLAWLPREDRVWRSLSLSIVGIGEILDGNLQEGSKFLLESLALTEQWGNHIYARAIRGMLSWASLERGELRSAAAQFQQMQSEARAQEDRDDIARTQLNLASILYQWNRLEEAELAAHEALEIGEQMQVEELQIHALNRLALIEQARGQSDHAQQRLTAWLARGQVVTSPASYQLQRAVQATQARIQLANGELTTVRRWLATNDERQKENLPLLQRWHEQLLYARLLLAQGELSAAIDMLERLDEAALQTGHGAFRLEVQAVLALAQARQGLRKQARKQLSELLEAARSEGYLRLFLDEGEEMRDLLSRSISSLAKREKPLLTYVRQILSAFGSSTEAGTESQSTGTPILLEPLSLQEQRVLRLLAAGNSNREIADLLVVSINTVRTQVQSIYRKLDVNNRVEASAIASQLELV